MLQLYISPGSRRRGYALSDTRSDDSTGIRLSGDELVEYLEIKAKYEKWQDRFRRQRRYGW